ncbi:MAG: hypothetical protein IJA61_02095 [Clostridia bacterium]|nr:hypothetical protein [Clostridia bacterium]
MNEIIELTERDNTFKVLMPVKNIKSIVSNDDGTAFIETGVDKKGESTGFYTKETFEDIKRTIAKLILFA